MYIELKFDVDSHTVYIPDGYVHDVKTLQISFLEWMQEQPECITVFAVRLGYTYNEEDFLRYVNSVILESSAEQAYFVSRARKNGKTESVIEF